MLKKLVLSATLLCVAGVSSAAMIVQDFVVARQLTNYTNTITFDLFNDMSGTRQLQSVEFILAARSSGSARVENENAGATSITATLATDIALFDAANMLIVEAAPILTRTAVLAGFDGVFDFAGPSGAEFLNLTTNDLNSALITDMAALMAYVGTGTSAIEFSATALSFVSGGGNITSSFRTFASGDVSIIYTYKEIPVNVSAPAQLAIMGFGLLALGGLTRTKR